MENMTDSQYAEIGILRKAAQNKKLDLSDALSEFAGTGIDANKGIMQKYSFRSAMGTIFQGIDLSRSLLLAICQAYGTGDLDPGMGQSGDDGGFLHVRFKQFANDFDAVPIPEAPMSDFEEVKADPQMYKEMQALRLAAEQRILDLTDAFEEYAGTGRDANLGVMPKNRFRAAVGTMFQGIKLRARLLDKICMVYATGDPDPREPGTGQKVLWKQFAFDFDCIPLPSRSEKPDPTPQIIEAMRQMNIYVDRNGIDLEKDFEAYMGNARNDMMPIYQFQRALGVILGSASSLYQLDDRLLEDMCAAYGAGEPLPHRPKYRELVQWREFVRDVNQIQMQPYLEKMKGEVVGLPAHQH